jgi:hypothetical protein
MARKYTSTINVSPYNVALAQPLDVRMVVENVSDLLPASLLRTTYVGMVVYVIEDSSLYVCYNKPQKPTQSLKDVEEGWRKVDVDYSVRIVETVLNITDGKTILFPYQGMMVYVTSEESLYILLTKGVENAKDIKNWKKISNSSSTLKDKVGINVAPEGGSGFKITENKEVVIEDYINVENYIKANYAYTSKGVNSFDSDPNFTYNSVKLSKGGDSYIELYTTGDNWMTIYDQENTFALSVTINGEDYTYGDPIPKETNVCFGVDIKFHDGWTISYGDVSRPFDVNDYDLIDIYRSEFSPEVYAYLNDIDVKVLTEDDIVNIENKIIDIEDKMDNLAHSIMIELNETDNSDNDDSDISNTVSLQQAILNINSSIIKLEEIADIETIEQSEIDQLFS